MKIGNRGIALIGLEEGFREHAYLDTGNVWTIGYGHTRSARPGMIVTKREAEDLLDLDLNEAEDGVTKFVKVRLTQSMFDALVSFVFNLGETQFRNSTLLRLLNAGLYFDVPEQLCRFTKDNGVDLLGLARRRLREGLLFLEDGIPST